MFGKMQAIAMQLFLPVRSMVGAVVAAILAFYYADSVAGVPGWQLMGLAVVLLLCSIVYLLRQLLNAVLHFSESTEDSVWSIKMDCSFMKDKFSVVERRIEGLVQAGRETQRHIAAMYDSYSLEGGRCCIRWKCRMIIEEFCLWHSARQRLGECCTLKAFCVLCRAAREQTVQTLQLDAVAAVKWCRDLAQLALSKVIKGCTQVHRGAYQPPAPPGGRAFK